MSEESRYDTEIAPFTQEQWDYIVRWAWTRRAFIATKQYSSRMSKIQALAGMTSQDVLSGSNALLDLAPQSDEKTLEQESSERG